MAGAGLPLLRDGAGRETGSLEVAVQILPAGRPPGGQDASPPMIDPVVPKVLQ